MTFLRGAAALLIATSAACQPMIFPRTGEIAKPGALSLQASMQVVSIEPQTVVETDRTVLHATVGIFPDFDLQGHIGLGRCETGLVLVDFGALAELRCAVTSQARGDALSIALSGAVGASASLGFGVGPSGRLGVDVSRRFGVVEPLVDLYISTSPQDHFVQTGVADDPVIAPIGITFGRREVRASIPIGVALGGGDKAHRPFDPVFRSVIIGVEPWLVVGAPGPVEIDPAVRSYATGWGVAFTFGFAFR